jgi:hypothetical protein
LRFPCCAPGVAFAKTACEEKSPFRSYRYAAGSCCSQPATSLRVVASPHCGDAMKIRTATLIGVIVVAGAAFFIARSLEDKATNEFVSQVSRLEIPAGWKPLDDIIRREQFLCASTNPCPSIARRWQAETAVTVQDLEHIAARADLVLSVEGTCQRPVNATGPTTLCTGRAVKDGYNYQLRVSSDSPQGKQRVFLSVRPSVR